MLRARTGRDRASASKPCSGQDCQTQQLYVGRLWPMEGLPRTALVVLRFYEAGMVAIREGARSGSDQSHVDISAIDVTRHQYLSAPHPSRLIRRREGGIPRADEMTPSEGSQTARDKSFAVRPMAAQCPVLLPAADLTICPTQRPKLTPFQLYVDTGHRRNLRPRSPPKRD